MSSPDARHTLYAEMDIKGIKAIEETLLDYPGHPAVIVYFHGCELRCPFCHNVGLVTREDRPDVSWAKLKGEVTSRVNLVEAVVASGGEPTLNPGLADFFGWMKEMELLTKLDTNGCRPEVLGRLLAEGYLDYVAMDVKHALEAKRYAAATGFTASFEISCVKESIDVILQGEAEHEFRTTVVPGLHRKADILSIARHLEKAKKYVLQQFVSRPEHIDVAFVDKEGYPGEQLRAWAEECSAYVPTEVRGLKV